MNLSRRQFMAATAAGLATSAATAQSVKPVVRVILPNAVGSGVDALARAAEPALSKALGASLVLDNQPGAGGIVGLQTLARSAPDGSALSIVSNNVVIFPSVLKSVPFKMPDDFTPIAMLGSTPLVLVVNANVPAKNCKEFVELLKSKPKTLNFGSGGNGTILHLTGQLFLDEAKVTATHIPFKGVGPMVTDLVGGQIEFAVTALSSVQAHIASGKLRAIGVASTQRLRAAPDIPTFVEQGLLGYVIDSWFALIGPKGMSADTVKRVHDAAAVAFSDPAFKSAMAQQGNTIEVSTPEKAVTVFKSDLLKFAGLVKRAGVEPS
jgi:tripartite-type tricarboxylate transporter receptor subunit TctC